MATFNPDVQPVCAANPAKCYFGKVPCLAAVCNAYGHDAALSWLEIQINDLANYAGSLHKLEARQSQQTASAILTGFPYLNAAEVLLFFARFKTGRYGRFYGAVDPLIITSALRDFCKERVNEITAIELARQAQEREKASEGTVSREEYERIKARAAEGDQEAIRQLTPPSQ